MIEQPLEYNLNGVVDGVAKWAFESAGAPFQMVRWEDADEATQEEARYLVLPTIVTATPLIGAEVLRVTANRLRALSPEWPDNIFLKGKRVTIPELLDAWAKEFDYMQLRESHEPN